MHTPKETGGRRGEARTSNVEYDIPAVQPAWLFDFLDCFDKTVLKMMGTIIRADVPCADAASIVEQLR